MTLTPIPLEELQSHHHRGTARAAPTVKAYRVEGTPLEVLDADGRVGIWAGEEGDAAWAWTLGRSVEEMVDLYLRDRVAYDLSR